MIDVSAYYIDDDTSFIDDVGGSPKKSLAGIQGIDTQYPYIEITASMFNNDGDSVVLFDHEGTIVDQYVYTKDPGIDVPFGRFPDILGNFALLAFATKGLANASILSTQTLSPTKILTPTYTPTSTKVPTLTKIQMQTKTPMVTPTLKVLLKTTDTLFRNDTSITMEYVSEISGIANASDSASLDATESSKEAVLPASISTTSIPKQKPKILVTTVPSVNFLPLLFSIGGGVCLVLCGIQIGRAHV